MPNKKDCITSLSRNEIFRERRMAYNNRSSSLEESHKIHSKIDPDFIETIENQKRLGEKNKRV